MSPAPVPAAPWRPGLRLRAGRGEDGYTLVEMLITVLVMGILLAMIVPVMSVFLRTGNQITGTWSSLNAVMPASQQLPQYLREAVEPAAKARTTIASGSDGQSISTSGSATVDVASLTGFAPSGSQTLLVATTSGNLLLSCTGVSSGSVAFTGCTSSPAGTLQIGDAVTGAPTPAIAYVNANDPGPYQITFYANVGDPNGPAKIFAGTNPAASSGDFKITITRADANSCPFNGAYGQCTYSGAATTLVDIPTLQNNTSVNGGAIFQYASGAPSTAATSAVTLSNVTRYTINASTTGFTMPGSILVVNSSGSTQNVSCTGETSSSFTGCLGGTGTLAVGGSISANPVFSATVSGASGCNAQTCPLDAISNVQVALRARSSPGFYAAWQTVVTILSHTYSPVVG